MTLHNNGSHATFHGLNRTFLVVQGQTGWKMSMGDARATYSGKLPVAANNDQQTETNHIGGQAAADGQKKLRRLQRANATFYASSCLATQTRR